MFYFLCLLLLEVTVLGLVYFIMFNSLVLFEYRPNAYSVEIVRRKNVINEI